MTRLQSFLGYKKISRVIFAVSAIACVGVFAVSDVLVSSSFFLLNVAPYWAYSAGWALSPYIRGWILDSVSWSTLAASAIICMGAFVFTLWPRPDEMPRLARYKKFLILAFAVSAIVCAGSSVLARQMWTRSRWGSYDMQRIDDLMLSIAMSAAICVGVGTFMIWPEPDEPTELSPRRKKAFILIFVVFAIGCIAAFPFLMKFDTVTSVLADMGGVSDIITGALITGIVALVGSCLTSFVALLAVASTTILTWQKNKKELELAQAKLELERMKIEKQDKGDDK